MNEAAVGPRPTTRPLTEHERALFDLAALRPDFFEMSFQEYGREDPNVVEPLRCYEGYVHVRGERLDAWGDGAGMPRTDADEWHAVGLVARVCDALSLRWGLRRTPGAFLAQVQSQTELESSASLALLRALLAHFRAPRVIPTPDALGRAELLRELAAAWPEGEDRLSLVSVRGEYAHVGIGGDEAEDAEDFALFLGGVPHTEWIFLAAPFARFLAELDADPSIGYFRGGVTVDFGLGDDDGPSFDVNAQDLTTALAHALLVYRREIHRGST